MRQPQQDAPEAQTAEPSDYVELNRFHTFDSPGETLSGVFVGAGQVQSSEGGVIGQFTLLDEDGFVTFNETSQMSILRKLPAGIGVLVTYLGEEKSGRNRLRKFKIQIARKDLPKVGKLLFSGPHPSTNTPALPPPGAAVPFAGMEEAPDPWES